MDFNKLKKFNVVGRLRMRSEKKKMARTYRISKKAAKRNIKHGDWL